MKVSFLENQIKEKLFANGVLVSFGAGADQGAVYMALINQFGIRVADDASFALLNADVLKDVETMLGRPLGEPFYRSFPESVRDLSIDEQIIDRVLHYMQTYGCNDHENRHFSLLEKECAKIPFCEKTEVKTYVVLDETAALKEAHRLAEQILLSRTINDADLEYVMLLIKEYHYAPQKIASKQILTKILLRIREMSGDAAALSFIDHSVLNINDVLRILGYATLQEPGKPGFKKLNLSSRDRKFYAALIEHVALHCDDEDIETAIEKRKDWKGFLHHLHFAPQSSKSALLVKSVFDDELKSVYSEVERLFGADDYVGSAKVLADRKGATALLRHLNRYLSVSDKRDQKKIVSMALNGANPVAAMQLALDYVFGSTSDRVIMYDYYGAAKIYRDHRAIRPQISEREGVEIASMIKDALADHMQKIDKKFYIDPKAKNVTLPLWSSAQSGLGVMNTGSRVDLPADMKNVRAFVYWEKERDLDLSGLLISRTKDPVEFSWRSGWAQDMLAFSGDVTDGVYGGAEYFDVNLELLKERFPDHKYLIFSVNNYSAKYHSFKEFTVRAGYMLREQLSSGEIFEPKTVQSAFSLSSDSRMAVMYAIDLENNQLVWINKAPEGGSVAANTPMSVFFKYIDAAKLFNVEWFFKSIAGRLVDRAEDADVIVGFGKTPEGKEYVNLQEPNAVMAYL